LHKSRLVELSYSLRHIGHTQSHTSNGYFKLVDALLQIHSSFFSHSIKIRGLLLLAVTVFLHYLPIHQRSTATCNNEPTIVTWREPLKICCCYCYATKTNSRRIRSKVWQRKEAAMSELQAHHYTFSRKRWFLFPISRGVMSCHKWSTH